MSLRASILSFVLASLLVASWPAAAQENTPPVEVERATPQQPASEQVEQAESEVERAIEEAVEAVEKIDRQHGVHIGRGHGDNAIVHVGSDSFLAAGLKADAVVSILGSSTSEGEVSDAVVSVMGDTRVTGPVGNSAVAVMGNTYVNSRIGGDVVAVMGSVELGPSAEVHGNIVSIGGSVKRDPAAVVHGSTQEIAFLGEFGGFDQLRPWFRQALFYGRPLAIGDGLGWAWTIALGALALYVLIALIFQSSVEAGVRTLEMYPGQSVLAALMTMLLTPMLIMLLLITVVGVLVVPFVGLGLFIIGLLGKTVVLAALGRRLTGRFGSPFDHVAIAVLLGGVILLGLYLIPVVGFLAYMLTGILGTGVVVYTFILAARVKREDRSGPTPATSGPSEPPPPPSPPRTEPFFSDGAQSTGGSGTPIVSSASFASAEDASASTSDVQASNASAGYTRSDDMQSTSGQPSDATTLSNGPSVRVGEAEATEARASESEGSGVRSEQARAEGAQTAGSQAGGASTSEARTSSAPPGGAHGGRSPPPPGGSSPSIAAASLPRAGFGIRMAALLIDIVLVGVILSVVFDDHDYMLLFLAAYGAAMWKLRSTTIGGIVCNLQVVRLDGRPIDWSTAVVRALSCFLSLVAAGLGFFWIIFDDGRQAWHDKIAGTAVVRVPKGIPLV